MSTAKLKENLIKYRAIILCVFVTIFALLMPVISWFSVLYYIAIAFSALFFSAEDALCVYCYALFYTGLTRNPVTPFILWGLLYIFLMVRHFYNVAKGREKLAKYPLLISIIFYLCAIIPFWNYQHIWGIVVPLGFVVPVYLAYTYRHKVNLLKVNFFMFFGLVVSALFALILFVICKNESYNIYFSGGRIQFFMTNPNDLGAFAIFIIVGFVYATFKRKLAWWNGMFLIAIATYLGSMAYSKVFLLTWFALMMLIAIIVFVRHKKIGLIFVGSAVVIGAIMFFCFRPYFDKMINRFLFSGDDIVNSITTNRWDVWVAYIKEQVKSIWNILLGMGAWCEIFLPEPLDAMIGATQSMYLEFFYYFGIVGVVIFIILIYSYHKNSEGEYGGRFKIYVKAENVLPLLMVLINGIGEMQILNARSIMVPLSIIYLLSDAKIIPMGSPKERRFNVFKQKKKEVKNEK